VSPLVEREEHPVFLNLDRRGDFQQVAEDRLDLGLSGSPIESLHDQGDRAPI